jgi:mRNA interferase MazF
LELTVVAPLTTTRTGSALHVEIRLTNAGSERVTYALPEQVRAVSHTRLVRRIGRASPEALAATRSRLSLLLRDDL